MVYCMKQYFYCLSKVFTILNSVGLLRQMFIYADIRNEYQIGTGTLFYSLNMTFI